MLQTESNQIMLKVLGIAFPKIKNQLLKYEQATPISTHVKTAGTGGERAGHKYIERKWKDNKWWYRYEDHTGKEHEVDKLEDDIAFHLDNEHTIKIKNHDLQNGTISFSFYYRDSKGEQKKREILMEEKDFDSTIRTYQKILDQFGDLKSKKIEVVTPTQKLTVDKIKEVKPIKREYKVGQDINLGEKNNIKFVISITGYDDKGKFFITSRKYDKDKKDVIPGTEIYGKLSADKLSLLESYHKDEIDKLESIRKKIEESKKQKEIQRTKKKEEIKEAKKQRKLETAKKRPDKEVEKIEKPKEQEVSEKGKEIIEKPKRKKRMPKPKLDIEKEYPKGITKESVAKKIGENKSQEEIDKEYAKAKEQEASQKIQEQEKIKTKPKVRYIDPEERDLKEVGDKKVKAIQFHHEELKPFIIEEAKRLLDELSASTAGKTWAKEAGTYEAGKYQEFTGQKRYSSEPIERLMDMPGMKWNNLSSALKDIIEDRGVENNAVAKRVELVIDDNLTQGTKNIDGYEVEPNEKYIKLRDEIIGKKKKEETEEERMWQENEEWREEQRKINQEYDEVPF